MASKRTCTVDDLMDPSFLDAFVPKIDETTMWSLSLTCKTVRGFLSTRITNGPCFSECYPHPNLMKFAIVSCGFKPATEKSMEWVAELCDVECFRVAHEKLRVPLDLELHLAAIRGKNIEMVRHFFASRITKLDDRALSEEAATQGDLEMLKFLFDRGCRLNYDTAYYAAKSKHWEAFDWLFPQSRVLLPETLDLIAKDGNLERIALVLDSCDISTAKEFIKSVLRYGHLDAIPLFKERTMRYSSWPPGCFSHIACATADDEVLMDAMKNGGCKMDTTCEYIEQTGNFECLVRIHEKYKIPLSMSNTCMWAATHGNMKMLDWAVSKGCEKNEDACMMAASRGDLNMLKWLRSSKFPWDARTCTEAANYGHLDVLEWVRSGGCEWDSSVYSAAAENGHLEVIKWARDNDCPWDDKACVCAIEGEQEGVLEWIFENIPVRVTLEMIKIAIFLENANILEMVLNHKGPETRLVRLRGHFSKWCVSDRRVLTLLLDKWDGPEMYISALAVANGTLACLKLLLQRGISFCLFSGKVAARNGKVHVLEWLKEMGFDIGPEIVGEGIANGERYVIEWGLKNRSWKYRDELFFLMAFGCMNVKHMIEFLVDNGLKLNPECCHLIVKNALPSSLLGFLLDKGCPVDVSFIKLIKENSIHDCYASVYEKHGSKAVIECMDD